MPDQCPAHSWWPRRHICMFCRDCGHGDTLKDHCLNGPFMRAAGVDIYVEICSGVDIHCIKLKVLLWLWNGALNSDTWYRSWHLKSLEESMGTVKTHSCWAPPTKFPLRRVLWYFTFGHLFRRKASCRTTKCFIGSFKMRPLWVYSLDTEQSNNLLISVNLMLSLTRALAHDGRWFYKSLSFCCSISWSLLLLLCPTEMRRSRDGQEEECSDRNL